MEMPGSDDVLLKELRECAVNLDHENVIELVEKALKAQINSLKIIDTLRSALDEIGQKYERGEYFLSELIIAGDLMKETLSLIESKGSISVQKTGILGKIVVGTVKGDMHDIGKNVFVMLAKASGFNVIDLGVDVSVEKFVETIRSENPQILGMSALLSVTMPYMADVIETLKREGLREKVKVIIGGAPITKDFGKKIGADYAAETAVEGVEMCKKWVMEG
jgi:5-methyltetrahydrofolate--homocysteine methyltransferase